MRLFFFLLLWLPLFAQEQSIFPSSQNEWGIIDLMVPHLPKKPKVVMAGQDEQVLRRMCGFWPKAEIYLFEPNPHHVRWLEQERHYFPQVRHYPLALDEKAQKARLYLSQPAVNPRIGSLLQATPEWKWYYSDSESIKVHSVSLEKWAAKHHLYAVDLIWLNAGGAELRILRGMPQLLRTVIFALVETHEQEFRQGMGTSDEVIAFLSAAGLDLIHQWKVPGYQGYSLFMRRGYREVMR